MKVTLIARQKKLKNRTVICGTLRPQDLIPTFAVEIEYLDMEGRYKKLVSDARKISLGQLTHREQFVVDFMDVEEDILDDLFEALNELAPEGCYFGAHPDDGSDFGFWEIA